jgi:hypothetical protein
MLDEFCNARVYKRDCMYKISVCGVLAARSESREDRKPSMERRGGTGAPRHKLRHAIEVTWVTQRVERAGLWSRLGWTPEPVEVYSPYMAEPFVDLLYCAAS